MTPEERAKIIVREFFDASNTIMHESLRRELLEDKIIHAIEDSMKDGRLEMDAFEKHIENEINIAERVKDQLLCQDSRSIYIGLISAFKASLACYQLFKESKKEEEEESLC